jgi:hypothetical protein
MVEVFKTNVTEVHYAEEIIAVIHKAFNHYRANFDLTDCDKILRIKCTSGAVESSLVITVIRDLGFNAEVLEDQVHENSGTIYQYQ